MSRSLSQQEKEQVRLAHAHFFQVQKRKHSDSPDPAEDAPTTTQPLGPMLKPLKVFNMLSTKSTKAKTPFIVSFYDPDTQAKDTHNRSMEDILSWSDNELERSHNYIQTLFPVPEGSAFNYEAPIINREVMEAFRSRSELRNRLRRAFERMLDFYGFKVSMQLEKDELKKTEAPSAEGTETPENTKGKAPGKSITANALFPPGAHSQSSSSLFSGYHIVRAAHWRKASNNWAKRFDHNHLRITRILRCLRVLGLQTECDAFFAAVKRVYEDPAIKISERSMDYWTRAVTRPLYIAPDDDEVEWLKKWEQEQKEAKTATEAGTVEDEAEVEKSEAADLEKKTKAE
jgi:hypothetical protein